MKSAGEHSPRGGIETVNFRHVHAQASEIDDFDKEIIKSGRRTSKYHEHGFAMARFMAYGDSLAELPAGADIEPNRRADWYVQDGSLLVLDYEHVHVGSVLSAEQIEAYSNTRHLIDEPAMTVLNRVLGMHFEAAQQKRDFVPLCFILPLFCGYNELGQQMVRLRTVTAGVLQEHDSGFRCIQFGFQFRGPGDVQGATSRKPAAPLLFLPATIGEIQPTRVTMQDKSLVSQRIHGVTVVDTLEQRVNGGGRRRRSFSKLGSLALNPRVQH